MSDIYLVTTTAAASGSARRLTTKENFKTALKITHAADDDFINQCIDRVSLSAVRYAALASDAIGSLPTFGAETLTATWYVAANARSDKLLLPWRVPVTSITSVVEDGTTLTVGTDYRLVGGGMIQRLSDDAPVQWSTAKIVVVYVAGWSLPGSVPPDIEEAVIEQVKMLYQNRAINPSIQRVEVPDVYSASFSVAGGSIIDESGLLPQLQSALAPYKNWVVA